MSFLLGAIVSVLLIISKVRKTNEYIPFGPFIVIATMVAIFMPFGLLFDTLITVFTLGMF